MNPFARPLDSRRSPRPVRALARWASVVAAGLISALVLWNSAAAQATDPKPAPTVTHGSLLALAQPLWSELSAFQRETLAPLEPSWNSLPLAKKRSWLALTEKMPRMSPAERTKAQIRIREWASLSPEQRRMARNNYRLAKSLDRDERVATWESYRQMTPNSVRCCAPMAGPAIPPRATRARPPAWPKRLHGRSPWFRLRPGLPVGRPTPAPPCATPRRPRRNPALTRARRYPDRPA